VGRRARRRQESLRLHRHLPPEASRRLASCQLHMMLCPGYMHACRAPSI
jgi:hypothetical protein